MRKLGSAQTGVLTSLVAHGYWYPNCGWVWASTLGTERILDTLVTRGLAVKAIESARPHRTVMMWRPTPEAIRLVNGSNHR